MDSNKPRRLVNDNTPAKISRALIALLNTYEDKPDVINMEYLPLDYGAALSVLNSPYVVKQYITGGYVAAYEFELVIRTIPVNNAQRLEADESLDEMVTWLIQNINLLDLPANIKIKSIDRASLAALAGRFENGAEDHVSALNLKYEVI
jgi:hypothetical protein